MADKELVNKYKDQLEKVKSVKQLRALMIMADKEGIIITFNDEDGSFTISDKNTGEIL